MKRTKMGRIQEKFSPAAAERGSTLLMVLALLSVLVLLATTLTFTSRLEVMSSHHFGKGVQLKTAVLTGVDDGGLALLRGLPEGATGLLDMTLHPDILARRAPSAFFERAGLTGDQQEALGRAFQPLDSIEPRLTGPMSQNVVSDASGRVNINTAHVTVLLRLFHAVLGEDVEQLPAEFWESFHLFRYGPDGAPGVAGVDDNRNVNYADELYATTHTNFEIPPAEHPWVDEPEEYVADIRYPAFGDDRRFHTIWELTSLPGLTHEMVARLEPYITVFSLSSDLYQHGGELFSPLDPNRATVEAIYLVLERAYGGTKDPLALMQFAANIVDSRDEDSVPTFFATEHGEVLGVERKPIIAQVYPDSLTPDDRGDDGQFIEIGMFWIDSERPWIGHHPADFNGWTLAVGGVRYPLQGTIDHRGGSIIITDDYDNSGDALADEDVAGTGSFYDVFGVLARPGRNILEIPHFDLPHAPGTYRVELFNEEGALIDRAEYTIAADEEPRPMRAFHRVSFLGGGFEEAPAAPFNSKVRRFATDETVLAYVANAPFSHESELMGVYAASGDPVLLTNGDAVEFPVRALPGTSNAWAAAALNDPRIIDARIVDLFRTSASRQLTNAEVEERLEEGDGRRIDPWADELGLALDREPREGEMDLVYQAEALAQSRFAGLRAGWNVGDVNINTASPEVLYAVLLRGQWGSWESDDALLSNLVKKRNEAVRRAAAGQPGEDGVLYHSLAEFYTDEDLWGVLEPRHLASDLSFRGYWFPDFNPCHEGRLATGGLANIPNITTGSRSFFLEGEAVEESNAGEPAKSGVRARALVALEQDQPELVAWGYVMD